MALRQVIIIVALTCIFYSNANNLDGYVHYVIVRKNTFSHFRQESSSMVLVLENVPVVYNGVQNYVSQVQQV